MSGSRPLVIVIGEPVLHAALAAQVDFAVHPVAFGNAERFMAALRSRRLPMDAHPTVIVCSPRLPASDRARLCEVVGEFMVVLDFDVDLADPSSVRRLRAAVDGGARAQLDTAAPRPTPTAPVSGRPDLRVVLGVPRPAPPERSRLANQIDPGAIAAETSARAAARPSPKPSVRRASVSHLSPLRAPVVVTVIGARQGVGASTVAVNLAARLSHGGGCKALLMDANPETPDLGIRFHCDGPTIDAVGSQPLDRWLPRDEESGVSILLAPPPGSATADVYRRALSCARSFDAVVIDCAPRVTDEIPARFALPASDAVSLVVTNDRAVVADARRVLDQFAAQEPAIRPVIVLNRYVPDAGLSPEEVGIMLDRPVTAAIPDDPLTHARAANDGRSAALTGPPALIAALDHILEATAPGLAPLPGPGPSDRLAQFEQDLESRVGVRAWVKNALRR